MAAGSNKKQINKFTSNVSKIIASGSKRKRKRSSKNKK